jgi:cell cycle checkpoint control protein RAD9A
MVVLNFTLSEEGVVVLHDALACMFKFSDDVCLEARKDKVPQMPSASHTFGASC